ncbi:MerR family transcriptional regulator [Actinoplanes sp. NPDC026670]|uniref:MerR family transcriptional regulator n=1 Tax=Actinoplanes sp. NPDC026670 TaxID=3154700 RepID=UPI0033D711F0
MQQQNLSAGSLARRLGVAPTTLRTWHQRYRLGPTGHETGRHRRYTPGDIATLTTMTQLTARGMPAADAARVARRATCPAAAEHPLRDPATDSRARGLARAARRLDLPALRSALDDAVTEHGVVHTWHTVAGPAFTHLSQAQISEPRRAAARRLLARQLSQTFAAVPRPPAGAPTPVLLVAAGNPRDLTSLDALEAALAEHQIGCLHLGAGLPDAAITDVVAASRPVVAVVWSHRPHPARPDLLAALTAAPGWPATVVTAGHGWPLPSPPGTMPAATLADAVAVVAALITESRG